jgi:hypothetical protein
MYGSLDPWVRGLGTGLESKGQEENVMKKILFASTAAGLVAAGGMASAQGVTVFGDARIGLGYNVLNNGSADQTRS